MSEKYNVNNGIDLIIKVDKGVVSSGAYENS